MIFHIESEDLVQVLNELKRIKINCKRLSELPNGKTPYQNFYQATDIVVEEREIPRFLKTMQKLSENSIIRLYKREDWQDKIRIIPYYRPYIIEDEKHPFLKTTFFYQKLIRAEDFLNDYSDINGIVYPSFLENLEITSSKKNHITGLYESISHPLNSQKIVVEDLGSFKVNTLQVEKAYEIRIQMENRRKVLKDQATMNNFLFQIPNANGISNYKMLEYFIPYDDDTIIHYGSETKKRELYLKKEGRMETIPYYKYDCIGSINETERKVEDAIENWSRNRKLK